jgi:hypothetical protein
MQGKLAKVVMGLIAMALAIAFFAPPAIKLKEPSLVIVLLIGVAAMVYDFIDVVRKRDED